MEADSTGVEDDLKITASVWKMTVSVWKMNLGLKYQ